MLKGILLLISLTLFGPSAPALAVEGPTLELGKTLFESTELGTSGRSCKSCHLDGKGLGQITQSDDITIKGRINRCLRNAQGGEVLDTGSQEMEALLNYVKAIRDE